MESFATKNHMKLFSAYVLLAMSMLLHGAPKKSIRWVQGSSHGYVPKKSEVIVWKSYQE